MTRRVRPGARRREAIDSAVVFLGRAGDQMHVPLFRAARDGLVGLAVFTNRRWPWAGAKLPPSRAAIVPIGDDGRPTGPSGRRAAQGALGWARHALIHASGGRVEHHEAALDAAFAVERLLLVETSSDRTQARVEALRGTPVTVLVPYEGRHPLPLKREAVR